MATEPLDPSSTATATAPHSRPSQLRQVRLDAIRVAPGRLRGRVEIDGLRESIAANGLLQPVLLDASMTLICGLHRLEACRELGWGEIPAIVAPWTDAEARLAEVDENLCRRELSVLERAEHIALRKKIWGELRASRAPTEEVAGYSRKRKAPSKKAELAELAVFVDDTAKRTGRATAAVREEIKIGELPEDVRSLARETSIGNNRRELLALARLPADEQREALERVRAGEARSVRPKSAKRDLPLPDAPPDVGAPPGPPLGELMVVPTDGPGAESVRQLRETLEEAQRALERALALWPTEDAEARGSDEMSPGLHSLRDAARGVRRLLEELRWRGA